jgi:hypothetical protein
MYKILAAGAFALMTTTAFAQTAPTFDQNQTSVFVDDSGTMRPEADARTRFMALPADQQVAIRDRCNEWSKVAPAGSSDLTNTKQYQTNPVPGVADMHTSCSYVSRFTP